MAIVRALLSVSDKTGIVEFARGLASLGIEILSTGGTASLLSKEGVKVTQVQDFTGAPEMLGGRVKTLHPRIHGGILARRKVDEKEMKQHKLDPIDLVVVNLYPFREAVAKGLPVEEVIENIDIGGPSMIRSAAKNAEYVTVVVDPADYATVLAELQQKKEVHESTRRRLQARAYAHTAAYDSAIAGWMAEQLAKAHPEEGGGFSESPPLPEFRRLQSLRYGENPHQRAAFYGSVPQPKEPTLAAAKQLQGKELSYNNILDGSSALEALKEHCDGSGAAVVIVKHTNPCGVARADSLLEAYKLARDADPVSAFGGIVACSRPVDAATGAAIAETFLEAVIAPSFDAKALEALKEHAHGAKGPAAVVVVKHTNPCGVARAAKLLDAYKLARDADPVSAFGGIVACSRVVDGETGAALAETFLEAVIAPGYDAEALKALKGKKSLRLLEVPLLGEAGDAWTPEPREVRSVPGGLLVQSRDLAEADPRGWKVVTKRAPTPEEIAALSFAWSVVKHVKSNAIVLARGEVTVGIGMGQTNRVDSVRIAAQRAGEKARGSALGSDAFFPFPDGVEAAAVAGVTAVAQPGGSVRDDEVIAAADKLGIAMVFTGVRHFRH